MPGEYVRRWFGLNTAAGLIKCVFIVPTLMLTFSSDSWCKASQIHFSASSLRLRSRYVAYVVFLAQQAVGGTEVNPIWPECRAMAPPAEPSHEKSLESLFAHALFGLVSVDLEDEECATPMPITATPLETDQLAFRPLPPPIAKSC